MPWCPQCKNEFQEGFTLCSDCKVELVEELSAEEEYVPFFQAEQKAVADKLLKYFNYSGLKSVIRYQEEYEVFILYVPEGQIKTAKKLYQAFYFVELERHEKELQAQASQENFESHDLKETNSLENGSKETDSRDANTTDSNSTDSNSTDSNSIDSNSTDSNSTENNSIDNNSTKFDSKAISNIGLNSKVDSSSNDSKEDTEVVYINERLTTSETGSESFQSGMALYSDTWNKTEANKGMEANDQEDIAEDNVSDEEASTPDSSSYVMKEDQYKDYSSTVWIFLLMGIAGIIFVILNLIGTLTFLNGLFPNVVMGALFLFFIYVGVSTYQKAKKIQSEIADEKQLTEQINGWLKEHLTKDYVSSLQDDTLSEELNYIRMTEQIKDQLMAEFGTQNEAYLDHLIEEYYSENIEEA